MVPDSGTLDLIPDPDHHARHYSQEDLYITGKEKKETRDVTKFELDFERWRISNNFTAFDIRRMWKLPSRRMRIHGLFTFPQKICKC